MKIILFLSFLACGSIWAQDSETSSSIKFKLQSQINAHFNEATSIYHNGLIPAILFETQKGYIHQIQVSQLIMNSRYGVTLIDGTNNVHFLLRGAYEFSLPLSLFREQELLTPFIGVGISNVVNSFRIEPNSSAQFPRGGTNYAADIYLFPSFSKSLNERFFFDCSFLIFVANVGVGTTRIGDPSIRIEEQRTNDFSGRLDLLKRFAVRFGFGMSL